MRVLVIGAGVIGSVYAARLTDVGHDVSMLARGARRDILVRDGAHLHSQGRHLRAHPRVLSASGINLPVDLTIVAVRANQLNPVLDLIRTRDGAPVAFLQHLGSDADRVLKLVGPERTVLAFPGIGGLFRADGSVEYVEIAAQPTTIDSTADQAHVLNTAISSTGMRTVLEPDMLGWLATHEVFVACLGAGVLSRGGEAERLARDPAQLRTVVQAIREGFASLGASGTRVTPTSLRILFSRMPRWFAAAYWRKALLGPVGTVAIAPHIRASRDDEFAALCANVIHRNTHPQMTPTLTALLEPWAHKNQ